MTLGYAAAALYISKKKNIKDDSRISEESTLLPVIKANTVLFWHAQTRISPSITRRGNLRVITQHLGC